MNRTGRSFVALDGLRGVAAICVAALHLKAFFGDLNETSIALAVDLFFVLSGFVLAHAYSSRLGRELDAWTFLKARWVRLYPIYILGTVIGIAQIAAVIFLGRDEEWTWQMLWIAAPTALLLLPSPVPGSFPFRSLFPANAAMWSVFYELLINAVWAIFAKPLQSDRYLIPVILCSAVGLTAYGHWVAPIIELGSVGHYFGGLLRVSYSFFVGLLAYRMRHRLRMPKVPVLLLLLALPAVLLLTLPRDGQLVVVLLVMPAIVLAGAANEPRGMLNLLCRKLGEASYAVYCLHLNVYVVFHMLSKRVDALHLPPPLLGAACILITIGVSLVVSRYDPAVRRWLTKRLDRRTRAAAEAEPVTQAP